MKTRIDRKRIPWDEVKTHLPALDGVRGLAISLVLLHHCYPTSSNTTLARRLSKFIDAGWIGVELFFVLSGFLITGILLDSKGQARANRVFFLRRIVRILPLYYIFIACYQLAHTCLPNQLHQSPHNSRGVSWPIWVFLTNMPQVFPVGPLTGSLGPLWSLAVEVQIYILWPCLVGLFSRRVLAFLLVAMLPLTCLGRMLLLMGWRRVDVVCCWTPAFFDLFAAGGLVAILARVPEGRRFLRDHAGKSTLASGIVLVLMAAWLGHFHVWTDSIVILGIGRSILAIFFGSLIALVLTIESESRLGGFFSHRALVLLGQNSFAMYLFHTPIYGILRPYLVLRLGKRVVGWSTISGAIIFATTLGATFLAASLSGRLIEAPLRRRFASRVSSPHLRSETYPPKGSISNEIQAASGAC